MIIYICTHIRYTHIHIYTCMHISIYTVYSIHAYIYIYIYIYIYAYLYMHTLHGCIQAYPAATNTHHTHMNTLHNTHTHADYIYTLRHCITTHAYIIGHKQNITKPCGLYITSTMLCTCSISLLIEHASSDKQELELTDSNSLHFINTSPHIA